MRWLSTSKYTAFADLLERCSAYAQLTGGRFCKDDFAEGAEASDAVAAAAADCRDVVATFRALCEESNADLVADYGRACADTVEHAVVNTMAATLRALDRYDEDAPPSVDFSGVSLGMSAAGYFGRSHCAWLVTVLT